MLTASTAGNHGGGFYASGGAPVIRNCEFVGNHAGSGGGLYVDGASTPRIEGCAIHDNTSVGPGGGVAAEGGAFLTVIGCTIRDNSGGDGGGLYVGAARAAIEATLVTGNVSPFGGGASLSSADDVAFTSVVIAGNRATVWGGALSIAYSNARIARATIARNVSEGGGVVALDGSLAVTDCILEGNQGSSLFSLEGYCLADIGYTDIWGNSGAVVVGVAPPGLGILTSTNANGDSCDAFFNLFADPVFLGPDAGDFHIDSSSPCVDAGDPDSGEDPDGSVADMGAFPATERLILNAQCVGSALRLAWNACVGTDQYWLFGAVNDAYFSPGAAPDFAHRLAVLPAQTTSRIVSEGVGEPEQEWTFVVIAVQSSGWELARSGRVGEREEALDVRR